MPLPSRSAPPPSASPSAHWVDRRGALRLCGSAWVLAGMATGGAAILGDAAWANPRVAPRADSPEVGVDPALVASGLTARWGQAMRRDLGWAARWTPLPSGALLRALAQGDIDMGLFLSHPQADRLAQEGLIHDRHVLARTDVLLLGPTQDDAGIRSETAPAGALRQVLAAHAAGAASWQAPPPDSALAAWLAGLGVQAPPKAMGAKARPADEVPYRLSTRAEWQAEQAQRGRQVANTRVWLQGSAAGTTDMRLACEVARPFRSRHPGTRLLSQWLQGPLGQQAVRASASAWQTPQG